MHDLMVSVIGLGYVGLPIATAFAQHCPVIGFDINRQRVNQLRQGIDITNEVTSQALQIDNLHLTADPAQLRQANFHIITVPTPVTNSNHPDLTPLISATKLLGEIIKAGDTLVYESTVYPGATEEICIPLLEEISGLKVDIDFFVGYSPERINPGDKVNTLRTITKVVSGRSHTSTAHIAAVYGLVVENIFQAANIRTAEAAKVIENTQRDLNIALMNELALIFNRMGLDTLDVLEAASTKWNFLPFKPGLVGGHCIGVDPYYLTYKSKQLGYRPEVILAGRRINDNMGKYIAQQVVKTLIKQGSVSSDIRIGILGLTFKEDCPDLRNSKVFTIIDELDEYGFQLLLHDPLVIAESELPFDSSRLVEASQLSQLDAIILGVSHTHYKQWPIEKFAAMLKPNGLLFDVKGCIDRELACQNHINLQRL